MYLTLNGSFRIMTYLYPSPNHNGIHFVPPLAETKRIYNVIKSRDERHVWSRCWGVESANTSGRTSRFRVWARYQARCRKAPGFLKAPRRWARRVRLRLHQESVEPSVRALLSVLHVLPSRRRSSAPPRVRRNWRNSAFIPRARYVRA